MTASHNPAGDNGYKVYDADGSQVVPPADAAIEAASARLAEAPAPPAAVPGRVVTRCSTSSFAAYDGRAVATVAARGPARPARRVHAVARRRRGGRAGPAAARGFDVDVVAEQADPDPDFPTVAFPNPEEPGALDLVLALAARTSADLVIANDPDADRCCVAVPATGAGARCRATSWARCSARIAARAPWAPTGSRDLDRLVEPALQDRGRTRRRRSPRR